MRIMVTQLVRQTNRRTYYGTAALGTATDMPLGCEGEVFLKSFTPDGLEGVIVQQIRCSRQEAVEFVLGLHPRLGWQQNSSGQVVCGYLQNDPPNQPKWMRREKGLAWCRCTLWGEVAELWRETHRIPPPLRPDAERWAAIERAKREMTPPPGVDWDAIIRAGAEAVVRSMDPYYDPKDMVSTQGVERETARLLRRFIRKLDRLLRKS